MSRFNTAERRFSAGDRELYARLTHYADQKAESIAQQTTDGFRTHAVALRALAERITVLEDARLSARLRRLWQFITSRRFWRWMNGEAV